MKMIKLFVSVISIFSLFICAECNPGLSDNSSSNGEKSL